MRFVVLSDMHGDLAYVDRLDAEFASADGVIFGGDFARFNEPETGLPALRKLLEKHDSVFAVPGNCDEPDFLERLEAEDVSVQGGLVFRDGLVFAGSGGALKFTGATPNERTDEELVSDFALALSQQDGDGGSAWPNMIAVMHQPPKDTACDMISGGIHVGSLLLREFIEKVRPLAVVTGHLHESAGIDSIGGSVVINPGSLAEGRYALLELERASDGAWSVAKAELREIPPD